MSHDPASLRLVTSPGLLYCLLSDVALEGNGAARDIAGLNVSYDRSFENPWQVVFPGGFPTETRNIYEVLGIIRGHYFAIHSMSERHS